ncbi:Heat shock protein 9/12 [Penicillium samsonianum]|uniref:Heat shock protein 9/12 n=1 Tax=Penicillium samsonianum TaxID=1882272 RepID=UPI002548508B|nr:Heat shock protein 9/12 [Penicillium samsonianum]KAJ6149261.1 Heat shock protein 9/12 [Penicillium samsonianum]
MSDTGRKDFSTKAKEEFTPDSTKSTQDKLKETVTDTTDRASGGLQTDDSKGVGQEVFDKTRREKDHQVHGGTTESIGDKIKNTIGLGSN